MGWIDIVTGKTAGNGQIPPYSDLVPRLIGWALAGGYHTVSATRDANEAIVTANIVWPDGATGVFTTDSLDSTGAINAYHATYVKGLTSLTVTQKAVTRDAGGGVTAQPVVTVS